MSNITPSTYCHHAVAEPEELDKYVNLPEYDASIFEGVVLCKVCGSNAWKVFQNKDYQTLIKCAVCLPDKYVIIHEG